LNESETYKYVNACFRDGEIKENGTDISKVMPKVSRFSKEADRPKVKRTILGKLKDFFEKFFDISSSNITASEDM
jgi:type I restriction enzyme R subunit